MRWTQLHRHALNRAEFAQDLPRANSYSSHKFQRIPSLVKCDALVALIQLFAPFRFLFRYITLVSNATILVDCMI